MKKVISMFLVVLTALNFSTFAFAEDLDVPVEEEVIEEYTYCSNVTSSLTISSNTATCKSVVTGISGKTTDVFIMQTLEKKSGSTWGTVAVWSNGKSCTSYTFKNKKTSLSKGTFRVKTFAKVYSGSKYETVTVYSSVASNS